MLAGSTTWTPFSPLSFPNLFTPPLPEEKESCLLFCAFHVVFTSPQLYSLVLDFSVPFSNMQQCGWLTPFPVPSCPSTPLFFHTSFHFLTHHFPFTLLRSALFYSFPGHKYILLATPNDLFFVLTTAFNNMSTPLTHFLETTPPLLLHQSRRRATRWARRESKGRNAVWGAALLPGHRTHVLCVFPFSADSISPLKTSHISLDLIYAPAACQTGLPGRPTFTRLKPASSLELKIHFFLNSFFLFKVKSFPQSQTSFLSYLLPQALWLHPLSLVSLPPCPPL